MIIMVERLTPIIKNIKQNIIKDTKETTKNQLEEEIVAILIAVVKEMVIMVMENKGHGKENKFTSITKKNANCVSLFYSSNLTMLIKSSWHSCWFYDKSISLLDNTILNIQIQKNRKDENIKTISHWNNSTRISSIQAQVSVNLNIGTAPSWGPSGYAQQNIIIYRMYKPIMTLEHPYLYILKNGDG
jgi:hypothetical protein